MLPLIKIRNKKGRKKKKLTFTIACKADIEGKAAYGLYWRLIIIRRVDRSNGRSVGRPTTLCILVYTLAAFFVCMFGARRGWIILFSYPKRDMQGILSVCVYNIYVYVYVMRVRRTYTFFSEDQLSKYCVSFFLRIHSSLFKAILSFKKHFLSSAPRFF